ncbi:peptidylprolyl isomerase [Lentisphaera profundi]|uniref:Peptidyl-prolyl cis-trans isomerase n=1 Tax=Lentisphaera profundi TaxID=1658616 RepID=A0ABY7VWV0_9BACT|nr:peptidylprolyl isomerase [Lentisphaera profundi]WDE98703.1 peptidylprolyl isomerase [Lentisphaera profundi]
MRIIKFLILLSLFVACERDEKLILPKAESQAKIEVQGEATLPTKVESSDSTQKAIGAYEHPRVKISTSKGDMVAELYEDKAPNTVANFVTLVESGFYKDMNFHRVIKGFMAQGGCPHSRSGTDSGQPGTGGPGYSINNEMHPQLLHNQRGILSMANSGPNTNGSQFFILFKESKFLNGGYSVYGRVIEGLNVLDKIETIGARRDGLPLQEQVTFSITLIQKNDHPYKVIKN